MLLEMQTQLLQSQEYEIHQYRERYLKEASDTAVRIAMLQEALSAEQESKGQVEKKLASALHQIDKLRTLSYKDIEGWIEETEKEERALECRVRDSLLKEQDRRQNIRLYEMYAEEPVAEVSEQPLDI